jgi:hypothetical protein
MTIKPPVATVQPNPVQLSDVVNPVRPVSISTAPFGVAQTFLSAGSRDIPVPRSETGGWKTAPTRRLESLRYV